MMRLNVADDGMCTHVATLPIVVLARNTKGMVPHRRNGPVAIVGVYGKKACVLVVFNGAFGFACLTRESITNIEPRFAEGAGGWSR